MYEDGRVGRHVLLATQRQKLAKKLCEKKWWHTIAITEASAYLLRHVESGWRKIQRLERRQDLSVGRLRDRTFPYQVTSINAVNNASFCLKVRHAMPWNLLWRGRVQAMVRQHRVSRVPEDGLKPR